MTKDITLLVRNFDPIFSSKLPNFHPYVPCPNGRMAEWPNGETLNEIYGLMETEYNSPFSSVMVHQISNHNHRKLAKKKKRIINLGR